jgi:IclR family acetate operon transcriptional repressor
MTQMKSLNKALDILEVFMESEDNEIRLSEIARESGLSRSNVNRIVSVLLKRGYLKQPEKWGKYSLGPKFLAYQVRLKSILNLKEIAIPYLVKLNHAINESVMLAEWDGTTAFYREMINTTHPLQVIPEPGREIPLYCTGIGKIILAHKTPEDLDEYFKNVRLTALTENTITDIDEIKAQLKIVARTNIAYDDEECFIGARNLASGVRDAHGNIVACVGVFSPATRLSRTRMEEITPDVKQCALEISLALGYSEKSRRRGDSQARKKSRKNTRTPEAV